jgi:hypothetical protein
MNLFLKYLNYQHSVLYVRTFFGNLRSIAKTIYLINLFFLRGFAYQGFQCQRCDCVVHKGCYNRFATPCQGKKYAEVKFIFETIS